MAASTESDLRGQFLQPPISARPWVYWFWMDGNVSREGITTDLEAMQKAGIGGLLMMEVDVGIPKGPVKFMSPEWRHLFGHAVSEAERLGLQITLNAGPGWTGSGGPWVKPEQSMQFLVSSATEIEGPTNYTGQLPQPKPRPPYFGTAGWPAELIETHRRFYRDVAVLAFQTLAGNETISDFDEKALFMREPYSSKPGVRPFLQAPAEHLNSSASVGVLPENVLDLTSHLLPDGRLNWQTPPGKWTVLRFGSTITGANTRPAPAPGLGFECDKFDPAALDAHFENYVGALLRECGPSRRTHCGWTSLHIDSWEMGSQNWTGKFREEFKDRRGYDPLRYLPVMTGRVVGNRQISERFLWDLRLTSQELVIQNHAEHLKKLGRRHHLGLSIEPYDMNPTADLTLGGVADVPMGEFWANCFESFYSVIEAASIAHTGGKRIVAAESFTSDDKERWLMHPGNLKALGDWAFCAGINRIAFHRYAHQPWLDRAPGMTMGIYGVHWERTQTWWDMAHAYHLYLARCQLLLRQGLPVADILYLAPEGAPHVFRPPASAVRGNPPERLGYNFDGCAPETLIERASVKNGRLQVPDGMSYAVLVLPTFDTMTPQLLRKVTRLVRDGATIIGAPPRQSPSLEDFPECDVELAKIATEAWGGVTAPRQATTRRYGKGRILWGGAFNGPAKEKPFEPLRGAQWIWANEANPASAAAVGPIALRREFSLPPEARVAQAILTFVADNSFKLWVNGAEAGSGGNFNIPQTLDIGKLLRPGTNVLTVLAENAGKDPNPAGALGALDITFKEGTSLRLVTDEKWTTAAAPGKAMPMEMNNPGWQPGKILGAYGMQPWGELRVHAAFPDIYPPYEPVAAWLENSGIPPDFESDVPLRYTHRRDGRKEIYFVANPASHEVTAKVRFRATGAVEFWSPESGEIRPAFGQPGPDGHRTSLSLRLDPQESVLVIFQNGKRQVVTDAPAVVEQSTESTPIEGPWEVEFQPGRGAPPASRFDNLQDWSTNKEPGIKFFSGVASYKKVFVWKASAKSQDPVWLDLGKVEVMAQVTLNGQDLGVAWKPPYRLKLNGALHAGENQLYIRVANLWPNRLIGDSALPQAERVASTTWNPFTANMPLLPSGLLGPVAIR